MFLPPIELWPLLVLTMTGTVGLLALAIVVGAGFVTLGQRLLS